MDVLTEVLKEISPSSAEKTEIAKKVKEFTAMLPLDIFIGGSYAKGTWLTGIKDVDVFVRFPKEGKLSDKLEKVLKQFGKPERLHGSRDYFRMDYKGLEFEIVPIVKIKKADDAANITDISPLHVTWVNANSNEKIRNGALLLKQFLKASQLYGAESYMQGFSGYVCEILVAHYKGFMDLMKAASKWEKGVLVDPEKAFKTKQGALMGLNTSKHGPLLLIDPVQASRNAAAALSLENFNRFVALARGFLKQPSEDYFKVKTITKGSIVRRKNSVWLDVKPLDKKEDVAGAKMMTAFKYIIRQSKIYGFVLVDKGWQWCPGEDGQMWFVFKSNLAKQHELFGPPLTAKEHVKGFRNAHKNCTVKRGRVFATESREFTEPEKFIKHLIKDEYIKKRVTSIR